MLILKNEIKEVFKTAKSVLPRYWELLNAREKIEQKNYIIPKSFLNEKCGF